MYPVGSKALFGWFLKCESHLLNYWHPTKSKLLFINLVPSKFLTAQFYFPELCILTNKIKSIFCEIYLVFIVYLIRVIGHFIHFFKLMRIHLSLVC